MKKLLFLVCMLPFALFGQKQQDINAINIKTKNVKPLKVADSVKLYSAYLNGAFSGDGDYRLSSGGFDLVNSDSRFSAMLPVRFNGFATNYDDSTVLINGLLNHPISGKLVAIGSIDTTGNFNYNHSWLSINPRGSMRLDIGSNDSLLEVGYHYIWIKPGDTIGYESHTWGDAKTNNHGRTLFGLASGAVIRDFRLVSTDTVMYVLFRENMSVSDDTLWMIDARDSSVVSEYKSILNGSSINKPSDSSGSFYLINAGTGITNYMLNKVVIRIGGNGSKTDITAAPQISEGKHGQIIELWGEDDANTVIIDDGDGVQLSGGISFTLGQGDVIVLRFFDDLKLWREVSRSNN